MTKPEATAEVFWLAFSALTRPEQHAFLRHLLRDRLLRRDLIDLALAEERRHETTRPLRDYTSQKTP